MCCQSQEYMHIQAYTCINTHARPRLLALAPGLRAPRFYLGQPVPQRLDHDAAVVITLLLIGLAQLLHPKAGNGE